MKIGEVLTLAGRLDLHRVTSGRRPEWETRTPKQGRRRRCGRAGSKRFPGAPVADGERVGGGATNSIWRPPSAGNLHGGRRRCAAAGLQTQTRIVKRFAIITDSYLDGYHYDFGFLSLQFLNFEKITLLFIYSEFYHYNSSSI